MIYTSNIEPAVKTIVDFLEFKGAYEVEASSKHYRCYETDRGRYWVARGCRADRGLIRAGKSLNDSVCVTKAVLPIAKTWERRLILASEVRKMFTDNGISWEDTREVLNMATQGL